MSLHDPAHRYLEHRLRTEQRFACHKPANYFRYRVIKRLTDVCLVLIALPLLFPLFALIAAIIAVDSPGSAFFSHRRIGRHGLHFSMWKFRTMRSDASAALEQYLKENPEARKEWLLTHKLRNDPRITRFGAFLRRTSLDEMPQIWNVLNGTMSLVGPRPIVSAEIEKYNVAFETYCQVDPGLTGLWQVSGRSRLSYAERVELDCEYVHKWTLWGDLVILARTFSAISKQEGAF